MPELAEVELYRRLAETALGRPIVTVRTPDLWYLKRGLTRASLRTALRGRSLTVARRIGKLLLIDTDAPDAEPGSVGPTLGLRFGMTGRLLVDEHLGVERLAYSSDRYKPEWIRFAVEFGGGGRLAVVDPRRLGGVFLDPDEDVLGPDAASVGLAALRAALDRSRAPLKARLMDQARLAGVGNLIADEVLWRAGLDPRRPASSLTPAETRRLHRHLRAVITDLVERGGSHMGDFLAARVPGGRCPRDDEPLIRDQVGGRTTWWCPRHQR
ncbi:MAG TPA: DNA-formamidopyrimidine glycosylase family protein [Acidimicrobiales bacterium]|nr:DNA-formamidopyrimidine glycosylase family protein [Acidimicrobiales bacterium]